MGHVLRAVEPLRAPGALRAEHVVDAVADRAIASQDRTVGHPLRVSLEVTAWGRRRPISRAAGARHGLHDAPWPPVYTKMPDESPRVAPRIASQGVAAQSALSRNAKTGGSPSVPTSTTTNRAASAAAGPARARRAA
jgi:hypothetical protein